VRRRITDPNTGERVEVALFVAVMGASNFTYAEVTATQQSADWIASHVTPPAPSRRPRDTRSTAACRAVLSNTAGVLDDGHCARNAAWTFSVIVPQAASACALFSVPVTTMPGFIVYMNAAP
jgi:hypothetical protein